MKEREYVYDIEHVGKRYDKIDTKVYGVKAKQWSLRIYSINTSNVMHEIVVNSVVVGMYSVSRDILRGTTKEDGMYLTGKGGIVYKDEPDSYAVSIALDDEGNLVRADFTKDCAIRETFAGHNEAMRFIDRVINPWHWYNDPIPSMEKVVNETYMPEPV